MRNLLSLAILGLVLFTSCAPKSNISKSVAYSGMYNEKPLTLLIMPPINNSNNVEAKEYFHSTLNTTLAEAGYYVIPPFLSMDILKRESAYDSEMFVDGSLTKFGEVFGADMVLFTIIHKWSKSGVLAKIDVEVTYIIKSTSTNEELYRRHGFITYDASINSSGGGVLGALVDMAASAINTAATKYTDVARSCNVYTLQDLPRGKYHPMNLQDGEEMSGLPDFRAVVKSTVR